MQFSVRASVNIKLLIQLFLITKFYFSFFITLQCIIYPQSQTYWYICNELNVIIYIYIYPFRSIPLLNYMYKPRLYLAKWK